MTPEIAGSRVFDNLISIYEAGPYVESHSRLVQDRICHVLPGEGVLVVDLVTASPERPA